MKVHLLTTTVLLGCFSPLARAEETVAAVSPALLSNKTGELLAKDDFDKDLSQWVVEQTPSGTTKLMNGKLDIDDGAGPNEKGGCTVWFKKKLSGSILVEYEATMVQQGGDNDRVSDLNCFWMAIDPKRPDDLFAGSKERSGAFKKYDGLRLTMSDTEPTKTPPLDSAAIRATEPDRWTRTRGICATPSS